MKLSEAIRLGSRGRTQTTGEYGGDDGSVCAIGAAMVAVGLDPRGSFSFDLIPRGIETDDAVILDVIKLNDEQHLTFEDIVGWLEERGR